MSTNPLSARDYARIVNKQQRLPAMLERARHRVAQLEAECVMYGMKELLSDPKHADKAWDRVIDEGRAKIGWPDYP